ncbi:hypothetical protein ABZ404_37095 [Streptomyces sp. NPDC005878]|uniref:hypothetical protein n=1 Tax=Streptomyces sp. NPDC005878 TaxID=3157077 RepID=UPI0033D36CAF
MQITTAKATGESIPFGTLVETSSGRRARTVSDTRTTTSPDGTHTLRTNRIQFAADDPHAPDTLWTWDTDQLTVIAETHKTLHLNDANGYQVTKVSVPLEQVEATTRRLLAEDAVKDAAMWTEMGFPADPRDYRVI